MRKLYACLIFALVGFVGNAQIVNIPDANFKAKLLSANSSNDVAYVSSVGYTVIDTNGDGEIQVSEAALINELEVSNSSISNLTGIEAFTNLHRLNCSNNLLSTLYLPNTNLTRLNCSVNQLTSLDVSSMTVDPQYGFDVNCKYNQLTSMTFPPFTGQSVGYIDMSHNLFETITLPNCEINDSFFCDSNPNLKVLNLKDNSCGGGASNFSLFYFFNNCPNLEYICVKQSYVSAAQSVVQQYNLTNCTVNTYCSFNPGGTYYTIQGAEHYDANTNGCDAADMIYPNLKLNITNGTDTGFLIADGSGNYTLPVVAGNHTISPVIENPAYFNVSPSTTTISFPSQTSPVTQDFCITPSGSHDDLEISLISLHKERPGENCYYRIIYKNKGTQTQSGSVNLTFDDSRLDFIYSMPASNGQAINTRTWNFSNLQPFETREIFVQLNLNSPLETPAVNAGDILDYTATVAGAVDETPNDNSSSISRTVVNSFDPNDKTCMEGASITPSMVGNYVHYVVRFENDGTADALNIVVKDMIDTSKFDISSLVPMSGSAPFTTRTVNTNQVEFIFENINLPFDDANNDGYVAFKIKTKPTLVVGDTFSNNASIYFDYNAPVVTNTYTTAVTALGTQDFDFGSVFTLSPVPAKNVLTITNKRAVAISSVSIYNTLGQLVQVSTGASETIDVSGLQTGSYFVRINSDLGSATGKFVKE